MTEKRMAELWRFQAFQSGDTAKILAELLANVRDYRNREIFFGIATAKNMRDELMRVEEFLDELTGELQLDGEKRSRCGSATVGIRAVRDTMRQASDLTTKHAATWKDGI